MACRLQNIQHHLLIYALYLYTDPEPGEDRIAKFTAGQYGSAVPTAWASAGLAPTLCDVEKLDCHSLLKTMELSPDPWQGVEQLVSPRSTRCKAS